MQNLRVKVVFIVGGVSVAAAGLMQLFNGVYFLRNIAAIAPGLPRFFIIVAAVAGAACLLIALRMGPLVRAVNRLTRREELTQEARLAARRSLTGVKRLIVLTNLVGFFIGPVLTIAATALAEHKAPSTVDSLLTVLLGVAIGLMAGLQQISLVDAVMIRPREALGFVAFDPTQRDMRVVTRLLLSALGSVVLSGILVSMAGLGFYREVSLWFATRAADATSSATSLASTAFHESDLRLIGQMGLLTLLVAAWSYALVSTTVQGLAAQIRLLSARMREIAEGDADLTLRASIVQFDEIGDLTGAINSVIGRLQEIVRGVRDAASSVASSCAALGATTEEAGQSVREIALSLDRVRSAVASEREAVETSRRSLSGLALSIAEITRQVATQANYVEESSASITEIAASISAVSQLADQAKGVARGLSGVSQRGGTNIQEMAKSMEEISRSSQAVNDIVTTISRISSQTNLLAMNAAIEAAHAGAAGKGFAVVADEVRALAESSSRSATDVVRVIGEMRKRIQAGVQLSESVKAAFQNISSDIDSTTRMIESIASSMGEQKAGADEILVSVSSLIEATEKIRSGSTAQAESSREVEQAVERIVEAAREIDGALADQGKRAEQLGRLIEAVNTAAGGNKTRVGELEGMVGRFR
jgi:methyl-accepting chemotaxis protein